MKGVWDMKKWQKWLVGTLSTIILLAIIAVGILYWYVAQSKPMIQGEKIVEILEEEVTVARDTYGVPHVTAKSDADLYRAQGYVQAQDRLFQMDLARRQASGRLAEVIGEAAVPLDKNFRTFSLRAAAEASYDGYGEEAKRVLDWYAEGVNAFIDEVKGTTKLSYEFKLLGYEPEYWTPQDSLVIGKYMAYDLGGHWDTLAFRHWALQAYGEEKAQELFTSYPKEARSIIEANLANPVAVEQQFLWEAVPPEMNGSNNWVVAGEKSESGMPLLADDPHLSLSTPSIWYEMHLSSPEQNVGGVIFAGIPGIILGHNEEIAWGVTNVGPDTQDLYIEIPNPEDPTQFKYDGQWEQAEVRDETIQVKGAEDIPFEVLVTRHGPIMSGLLTEDVGQTAQFSMQWPALEPTVELEAVIKMNKSKNWEEFEEALTYFRSPAQNFVFADRSGTIAYKANGNIPIRKQGTGQLPVPGDSSDYGWEGYIPYDELPRVVNPEKGWIATANNEIVGEEYPYHISSLWAQPYRYERIAEVLESKEVFSVQDMEDLQMDQKNLYAIEFLDDLMDVSNDVMAEDIQQIMSDWDYMDDKAAAAPLVFNRWMTAIREEVLQPQMSDEIFKMMPAKGQIVDEMLRQAFQGQPGTFIEEAGGVEKVVQQAYEKTIAAIEKDFGKQPTKWQWGDYHLLTFNHSLGSASPILAKIFNPKPVPIGGSGVTVQAAGSRADGTVDHGASWRFVADIADLEKTYHTVGPGQSGHRLSKWYKNQVQDWADGKYHATTIRSDVKHPYELRLLPKNK